MPARRRNRQQPHSPTGPSPSPSTVDTTRSSASAADERLAADLARFNASLAASAADARRKVEAAEQAAFHERQLQAARQALDAAIAGVRRAKESGHGRAEADVVWRAAKADVIRLETGQAPAWAPTPPEPPADDARPELPADDSPEEG